MKKQLLNGEYIFNRKKMENLSSFQNESVHNYYYRMQPKQRKRVTKWICSQDIR